MSRNFSKEYIDKLYPNFVVVGEYITMHTKTKIRCTRCLYEWSPTPTNFLRRIKCKNCENSTKKKIKDILDVPYLSNPCILYILGFEDLNTKAAFIKVGITSRPVKYRIAELMQDSSNLYKISELATVLTTLSKARDLEQTILKKLSLHRYYPARIFDGHTELLPTDKYYDVIRIIENNGYTV